MQTDATAKQWLKSFVLRSSRYLVLGPKSKFALGEYEGNSFLIAIGLEVVDAPAELQPIDLNAGIFTAVVSELELPVIRTDDLAQRLLEYVFYPVERGVELLDMRVLTPFFQNITIFKIDPVSALALDKEVGLRAATAAILGAPQLRALAWPMSTLDRLKYMVRDPAECSPFHLILRALTETRDDAAFLALYRCIEQLFPVPAMAELSAELGLQEPALHVAAVIERQLGWRRREEDALAHLFGDLDGELVKRMQLVIGPVDSEEISSRAVSKRVYELRNQCVHYRPIHARNEAMKFHDWLALSDLMLEVIQCLYAKYAAAFNEPKLCSTA